MTGANDRPLAADQRSFWIDDQFIRKSRFVMTDTHTLHTGSGRKLQQYQNEHYDENWGPSIATIQFL